MLQKNLIPAIELVEAHLSYWPHLDANELENDSEKKYPNSKSMVLMRWVLDYFKKLRNLPRWFSSGDIVKMKSN